MKFGLSIRQAAHEYGIGRGRLSQMIERGEIRADTSRPGYTLIPRGEMDRVFRGAQVLDLQELRRELEHLARAEARAEVRRLLSALAQLEVERTA